MMRDSPPGRPLRRYRTVSINRAAVYLLTSELSLLHRTVMLDTAGLAAGFA